VLRARDPSRGRIKLEPLCGRLSGSAARAAFARDGVIVRARRRNPERLREGSHGFFKEREDDASQLNRLTSTVEKYLYV